MNFLDMTFRKLVAVLRRDLLTALRATTGLGMVMVAYLVELATFYYLSKSIGSGYRPDGTDYYAFLLIGSACFNLIVSGIHSFVSDIRDAQISGIMEVLMTTSTPGAIVILLGVVSNLVGKFVNVLVYVLLGLVLFNVQITSPNLAGAFLVLFLISLLTVAGGLFAAAIQLWLQKGGAVVWLLSVFSGLLSGVLFSVNSLPVYLRLIAEINPVSHALTALRLAMLKSAPWSMIAPQVGILTVYVLLLLPASFFLFSFALRQARRSGSLSFY